MVTGIEDCLCTLACGRVVPCGLYVVPCGARQVWPDLPANYVEAQPVPERDPLAGHSFAIGEPGPSAEREPRRKWRANRWER